MFCLSSSSFEPGYLSLVTNHWFGWMGENVPMNLNWYYCFKVNDDKAMVVAPVKQSVFWTTRDNLWQLTIGRNQMWTLGKLHSVKVSVESSTSSFCTCCTYWLACGKFGENSKCFHPMLISLIQKHGSMVKLTNQSQEKMGREGKTSGQVLVAPSSTFQSVSECLGTYCSASAPTLWPHLTSRICVTHW